jgi:RNA polymerase sigma-70 factor (ECF subfamily)
MIFGRKYNDRTDEELMGLIRKKDSRAFEEIYDRYSQRMVNYFYKMLWQDEEKAQDFMHDLFAKIIEKPEQFDSKRVFKTWFFSIAHNMCKNEYRKQSVRSEVHAEREGDIKGESGEETTRKIDRKNFRDDLMSALDELGDLKKNTFILRYQDEMSIKEISEAMECSEGTVKSRLFYTLKLLNEKLKVYEGLGMLVLWIKILFQL